MKEFLTELFPNVYEMSGNLLNSIWQTFVMVGIAGIFGITIGTLLGVSLVASAKGGLCENDPFNNILGKIVNTIRSISSVILIALTVSFTRFLVGTSAEVRGATVPVVARIALLVTRITEQVLPEVDPGVMEAARFMGISRPHIIVHVPLQESLPGLLQLLVIGLIGLVGLSATAGSVGGGGIGSFTTRYDYPRYMNDITAVTALLLLLIANIVQSVGNRAVQWLTH